MPEMWRVIGMKEIGENEVEALEDYLNFTAIQKKAITNLKKAFTRCRKIGLNFWDNYGTLTVYDGQKMTRPVPDDAFDFNYEQEENCINCCMGIGEAGDTGGNADDTCQFSLERKTLMQIMADYYEGEEGE